MSRLPFGDGPAFAIQDFIQVRDNDWNEVNRAFRNIWNDLDAIIKKLNAYPDASALVTQDQANANYGTDAVRKGLIGSGYLSQFPFLYGIPNGSSGARITWGTLSPNTKPVGLTLLDAYNVLFYAIDYDRMYIWDGFDWVAIDYDAGSVHFFITAPTSNGWHLCNGVGSASMSLPDGSLTTVSVPNLTGSTFIRGSSSYDGPSPTAAVAPTISGTITGTIDPFTPTGTVTGDLPDHPHSLDGTPGAHTQEALNISDNADWVVTGTIGGTLDLPQHTHDLSTLTTTSGDDNADHDHLISAVHAISPNGVNQVASSTVSGIFAWTGPDATIAMVSAGESVNHQHDVDFSGFSTDLNSSGTSIDTSSLTFDDTSLAHYHDVVGNTGGIGDEDHPPPFPLDLTFTADEITPVFHGDNGTLAVDDNGAPKSMGLLPYLRL